MPPHPLDVFCRLFYAEIMPAFQDAIVSGPMQPGPTHGILTWLQIHGATLYQWQALLCPGG